MSTRFKGCADRQQSSRLSVLRSSGARHIATSNWTPARLGAAALALAMAVTTASWVMPAGADDKPKESIDQLRASDAELTGAIAKLDVEVAAQQAAVATAQQALEAANQAVVTNEAALAETQSRLGGLQEVAADRAVSEYMRPRGQDMTGVVVGDGGNFGEVSRRAGLLREVNDRQADALDQVRAVKIELDDQQQSALAARKLADDRRVSEQAKLDQLNAARADKARLDAGLQERIAAYAAEDEASARMEASSDGGRANRGGGGSDDGRTSAAGLRWPADNRKVNSTFGTRWGRAHKGIDIQASVGDNIYAAKGGTVKQAGWESGYGQYTCIDHGGGFSTCYAHQSSISVRAGGTVSAGQLIGKAGNTGASQGAHLHFETRVNGEARNPTQYLP